MILLTVFIFIFLGLNFKNAIIPFSIVLISAFVYVFLRFKKKFLIIALISASIGVGVSYINFSFSNTKFEGVVIESKENYFILSNYLEKYYVYEKDNNREIGDLLSIKGKKEKLDFEVIESSFDFNSYLNKKGVYYEIVNYKISVKFNSFLRTKAYKENFLSKFNADAASFISLLMFSDDYDSEGAMLLNDLQLNRLMTTSGFYLNALYYLLTLFFSLFLKEKKAKITSFIILFIFSIFLFPKFSVLRFMAFSLFGLINEYLLKNKFSYIERLSLIALFFISFDYHIVYSDSFVLGFFLPLTIYFLRFSFNRLNWWQKPIALTLSIYIFMIPFILKFDNYINIFALPLQIILTPIFIIFYILSFISFFGIPIYFILNHLYLFLLEIIKFCSIFKISIHSPPFSFPLLIVFETLYFSFHYYYSIIFKPIYKKIALLFTFFLAINFLPIKNLVSEEVSFINVGQGDSTLIRKGDTSILIDTGGSLYKDVAKECLIPYFKKKRIYDIDLLIITHDDFDHNGAANSLTKNFKVRKILDNKDSFPYKINDITIYNLNRYEFDNDNENSLVLYFDMWGKKFLVMGDASKEVEENIIKDVPDLKCDYLRVGHHGSDTSSSKNFISYISPKEAIISVGENRYGHPHLEVLSILKRNNIKIRITDIEGTITYTNYIFM